MNKKFDVALGVEKKPKPIVLVLGIQLLAFVVSFFLTSIREYGGFGYFEHELLVQDVIAQSIGAVFVFPLLHVAIASFCKSKRNKVSRRNIFLGWAVAVFGLQMFGVAQLVVSQ